MQAIILQSFVGAPPAAVWAALRERTDLLFDGLPAKAWPAGGDTMEPAHFTAPWPFTEPAGAATEVSVTLHDMGGGTKIDLRHKGWGEGARWDEMIQGHFAGWLQGLAALGVALEAGIDPRATVSGERYFISGEIPADASAVYRALTDGDVLGRWSGDSLGIMNPAETVEDRFIRWKGATEITAILRPTPRGTHLAIAEYGVKGRRASDRWPGVFEKLATFLG